jgi:hypothetical protein
VWGKDRVSLPCLAATQEQMEDWEEKRQGCWMCRATSIPVPLPMLALAAPLPPKSHKREQERRPLRSHSSSGGSIHRDDLPVAALVSHLSVPWPLAHPTPMAAVYLAHPQQLPSATFPTCPFHSSVSSSTSPRLPAAGRWPSSAPAVMISGSLV